MSKTYKQVPYNCLRSPKGHKKILAQYVSKEEGTPSVRYGAIPRDPWDDIPFDKQVWIPYNVCENMIRKGWSEERVVRKLMKKFHMSSVVARHIWKMKKKYE